MICWYCYHGWSQKTAEVYKAALAKLGGDDTPLEFGPGHIVWSDENFEEEHIRWCLGLYDPATFANSYPTTTFEKMYENYTPDELAIVKESLEALLKIPEDIRCPEPADYDEEHPELFPPREGVVMVKI